MSAFEIENECGAAAPLNDRVKNPVLSDFLSKVGLVNNTKGKEGSSKIFGLFKR